MINLRPDITIVFYFICQLELRFIHFVINGFSMRQIIILLLSLSFNDEKGYYAV